MKTLFTLEALCEGNPLVIGFSSQGPAMWTFDDFSIDSLNKLLNKELSGQSFETF